jgi:hypothetical protein
MTNSNEAKKNRFQQFRELVNENSLFPLIPLFLTTTILSILASPEIGWAIPTELGLLTIGFILNHISLHNRQINQAMKKQTT